MSLNYEKIHDKKQHGVDFWTSYADLATVLTTIFLTMYAVATLRTTTVSISERAQVAAAQLELEEMRAQNTAFDVMKDEYLQKGASQAEKKMYSELMGQMKLLEEEAEREKGELYRQAKENEKRADGLNKYQKTVRNIITANMLAQSEMKSRDDVIARKTLDIKDLNKAVRDREKQITKNNREIESAQAMLERSIAETQVAYRQKAASRKVMEERIAQMRIESAERIARLRENNDRASRELLSAKSEISQKSRELEKKETVIAQKQTQVRQLETEKSRLVSDMQREQAESQQAMADLQAEYRRRSEIQRAEFQANLRKEKLTASAKLQKEREYAAQVEREKLAYDSQVRRLETTLEGSKREIAARERELAGQKQNSAAREAQFQDKVATLESEKAKILGNLAKREQGFQQAIEKLNDEYQVRLSGERRAYEDGLAREKLTAAARLDRERAYRAKIEREKAAYDQRLGSLEGQLQGTRSQIAAKERQIEGTKRAMEAKDQQVGALNSEKKGLERELAAIRAREEARKKIVARIEQGFKKAGVSAKINVKTGEVMLNFEQEYFDYGKSTMKSGMQKILQRAFPLYAKGILEDPEIAKKISSVEIVGFASPTFKGKYVNPKDLSPEARRAVNYNMDLSYQRAKAIFDFVFDPQKMDYRYQKDLLSLTKVTGLGYLRSDRGSTEPDGKLTDDQYCEKYDCSKSQKVIIKFNFADR